MTNPVTPAELTAQGIPQSEWGNYNVAPTPKPDPIGEPGIPFDPTSDIQKTLSAFGMPLTTETAWRVATSPNYGVKYLAKVAYDRATQQGKFTPEPVKTEDTYRNIPETIYDWFRDLFTSEGQHRLMSTKGAVPLTGLSLDVAKSLVSGVKQWVDKVEDGSYVLKVVIPLVTWLYEENIHGNRGWQKVADWIQEHPGQTIDLSTLGLLGYGIGRSPIAAAITGGLIAGLVRAFGDWIPNNDITELDTTSINDLLSQIFDKLDVLQTQPNVVIHQSFGGIAPVYMGKKKKKKKKKSAYKAENRIQPKDSVRLSGQERSTSMAGSPTQVMGI